MRDHTEGTLEAAQGRRRAALDPLDAIMHRYATGEQGAFRELYKALAPRLRRFCLRLSRQHSEAEDLLQDVFLRLHRARATYAPGAPALPWAFTIVRSAHCDRLRRRRRRPEDLIDIEDAEGRLEAPDGRGSSPESEVSVRDLLLIVRRELDRMPEKNRRSYVLLREDGLTLSEAAAVMGTSCDTARQRAHRAHEQIKAALHDAGWDRDGSKATAASGPGDAAEIYRRPPQRQVIRPISLPR